MTDLHFRGLTLAPVISGERHKNGSQRPAKGHMGDFLLKKDHLRAW